MVRIGLLSRKAGGRPVKWIEDRVEHLTSAYSHGPDRRYTAEMKLELAQQNLLRVQDIVRELRKQGIAILVTDHQAREILKVTDRIYVISAGEVVTARLSLANFRDFLSTR